MKAVRFHQHGGPEVLRYEDAPDPQPVEGRAIVRVRACALNHLDLWERRGIDRVKLPLPHISGADVAGEVLGTGQRVMLQPGLRCGACAACRRGDDNHCVQYDVLGLRSDGGYAELVSIPVENLIPIPATLDFITAAAFPLTFLTAWHMLVARGRLRDGDVVLVLAGGSGVGQAAIQLARHFGARVFATSAPEKAERTRALGAEEVFDHYSADFSKEVRRLTEGAAPTSSSSTSARRPGIAASARSPPGGAWSPAARPAASPPRSICVISLRASCRCSARTWGASPSSNRRRNCCSTAVYRR